MTEHLHPPIGWIESALFGSKDVAAETEAPLAPGEPRNDAASDSEGTEDGGWSTEQLRFLVESLDRSRVEARNELLISPGQIRQLRLADPPDRPIHLLISKVGPLLVHGWLVVSETDYASDMDWVLQEEDVCRALASSVAVVQLWNHRQLPLAVIGGSVNEFTDPAWHDLQLVAGHLTVPGRPEISAPSALASVVELAGVEFVTGAPLSEGARFVTERQAYRQLYERWAEKTVMNTLPSMGKTSSYRRWWHFFSEARHYAKNQRHVEEVLSERRRLAAPSHQKRAKASRPTPSASRWKTLALASVAALALTVAWPLFQQVADDDSERFRAVTPSGAPAAVFLVHLAPQTTVQDLTQWLSRWEGQVTAGPNESGGYQLLVPKVIAEESLTVLRDSALVERVQLLEER